MSDETPMPEHMLAAPQPISELKLSRGMLARLGFPDAASWTDEEVLALKEPLETAFRLTDERNAAMEQVHRQLMQLRRPQRPAPLELPK